MLFSGIFSLKEFCLPSLLKGSRADLLMSEVVVGVFLEIRFSLILLLLLLKGTFIDEFDLG